MKRFIKLPNAIWSYGLSSSELHIYTAIAAHANRFGGCCVRHELIAKLCGVSAVTVSRAVQSLARQRLIDITKRYNRQGQLAANRYTLTPLGGSFTRIPCDIWGYRLAKSDFKVMLYLLRCRCGNSGEAFPSLSQLVCTLHMSKRTIIDATNRLSSLLLLYKERYARKQDNKLGHNRYRLILGIARRLLAATLAALAKKEKTDRSVLESNPPHAKDMPYIPYRIAYAAQKVKSFFDSMGFLLRNLVGFTHKYIGTTLIRQ